MESLEISDLGDRSFEAVNFLQFTKTVYFAVGMATGAIPTFEPFVSFRYKQRILYF